MYRFNSVRVCPCFKKYLDYAKIFDTPNCIAQCGVLIRYVFTLIRPDAVRIRIFATVENHFYYIQLPIIPHCIAENADR